MNISKVAEQGAAVIAGVAALTCIGLNSCSKKCDSKPIQERKDSIDITKPNLPVMNKDSIYYLGLDGKLNSAINSGEVAAVYNAISKMSTTKNPDITDTDDFYLEVQKNIQAERDDKNTWVQPRIEKNVFKSRLSDYFDKVFQLYTKSESDGGSTITVKEYTKMMDAFSVIKPCGKDTP